jgi:hypothetical protein
MTVGVVWVSGALFFARIARLLSTHP